MLSNKVRNEIVKEYCENNVFLVENDLVNEVIYEMLDSPEDGFMFKEWESKEELIETIDTVIQGWREVSEHNTEEVKDFSDKLEEVTNRQVVLRSLEIVEEEIINNKIETLNSIFTNSTNSVEGWDYIDTSIEEVEELNKEVNTEETLTEVKEEFVLSEEFNTNTTSTIEEKKRSGPAFILLSLILLSLVLLGIVLKVTSLCFNTVNKLMSKTKKEYVRKTREEIIKAILGAIGSPLNIQN